MTPQKRDRGEPAPGNGSFEVVDLGEPHYHTPVGAAKGIVRLVPADVGVVTDAGAPRTVEQAGFSHLSSAVPDRPLVPASEEVAKLPRGAREAFAARCAARVAPLRAGATSPEAVAALILAAANVETPIRRQLLRIRRDFDRLAHLAKTHGWTDDTPVPPDVFGPMWTNDLAPDWAKEQPASAPPPAHPE